MNAIVEQYEVMAQEGKIPPYMAARYVEDQKYKKAAVQQQAIEAFFERNKDKIDIKPVYDFKQAVDTFVRKYLVIVPSY